MRFISRRSTPAIIVLALAAAVALPGQALAAKTLPKDSVTKKAIKKGAVTKKAIAKNAVTKKAIKNQAVTAAKLAIGAIEAGAIAAGAVTTEAIADGAVTAGKLAAGAVTAEKLAAGAVTPEKIAPLAPRRFVGAAGEPQFSNGGQGDCVWQKGSALVPGLGDPSFYKDQLGIVHLEGIAQSTSGSGGDQACNTFETPANPPDIPVAIPGEGEDGIVFTLPAGYRPQFGGIYGFSTAQLLIAGEQPVDFAGFVLPPGGVYAASGGDATMILDGITFRPAGPTTGSAPATRSAPDSGDTQRLRELLGLE